MLLSESPSPWPSHSTKGSPLEPPAICSNCSARAKLGEVLGRGSFAHEDDSLSVTTEGRHGVGGAAFCGTPSKFQAMIYLEALRIIRVAPRRSRSSSSAP